MFQDALQKDFVSDAVGQFLNVNGKELAETLTKANTTLTNGDLDNLRAILEVILKVTKCFSLTIEAWPNEESMVFRGQELQETNIFLGGNPFILQFKSFLKQTPCQCS